MRRLTAVFPMLLAAVMMLTMPLAAEAKRMGGGGSMGKQYSMPQRSATPPAAAPAQGAPNHAAPAQSAPRQSGASRWLGPIAGLVAGGLIASMLFGDGFEGFQFMDFLLIAALAIGAFFLFRMLMRPRHTPQPAGGPALGNNYNYQGVDSAPASSAAAAPVASAGSFDAPSWFNADSFLKGARVHFIRLQAAWDKGDMKDIATYTTPELFAELQADRLSQGNQTNYTEVVYIDTELLGVQRDGDNVVASVRFHGGIKEEQNGATDSFNEVWHVIHAWDNAQGDWYVAGIQQM